ncbi:hypothetical protein VPH35_062159 [Triticum aestivum]|uniref:Uncharacterized protein n=1 Tax=Aegilops tauschii TaxID=37682 RepID=N1QWB9_AEGTA
MPRNLCSFATPSSVCSPIAAHTRGERYGESRGEEGEGEEIGRGLRMALRTRSTAAFFTGGVVGSRGADGAGRSGSRSRGEQQSVLETYNPVSGRIYAVLIVLGASLALRLVSLAVLHRRPEKQVWSIRRAAQVSGLNCLGFSKGIATYWLWFVYNQNSELTQVDKCECLRYSQVAASRMLNV